MLVLAWAETQRMKATKPPAVQEIYKPIANPCRMAAGAVQGPSWSPTLSLLCSITAPSSESKNLRGTPGSTLEPYFPFGLYPNHIPKPQKSSPTRYCCFSPSSMVKNKANFLHIAILWQTMVLHGPKCYIIPFLWTSTIWLVCVICLSSRRTLKCS